MSRAAHLLVIEGCEGHGVDDPAIVAVGQVVLQHEVDLRVDLRAGQGRARGQGRRGRGECGFGCERSVVLQHEVQIRGA